MDKPREVTGLRAGIPGWEIQHLIKELIISPGALVWLRVNLPSQGWSCDQVIELSSFKVRSLPRPDILYESPSGASTKGPDCSSDTRMTCSKELPLCHLPTVT